MATFKSLFEKAMLRLGSRGSVPAENYVDVTTDNYIAPADGMAYLQGSNALIVIEVTNGATKYGALSPSTALSRIHVPVKKGLSILFDAGGATNMIKRFYYSVGGGVNFFARCLTVGGRYAYH